MLALLILVPLIAGLAALLVARIGPSAAAASRWTAAAGLAVTLALAVATGAGSELDVAWLPTLGVRLHLAMDGLSLVLVVLAALVGLLAVKVAWRANTERVGLLHLCLLWTVAGAIGVFLAVDLVALFVFWELMIVPMVLIIALWGHADRRRAALKLLVFTQAGGLLMLAAIVGLAAHHAAVSGTLTFDRQALLGTAPGGAPGMLLMLGFFAGFAVKLPAFGLHPWLPDAHTQAPTAGSVVLAGLLLKTGAYGLVRFAVPLFPDASAAFAPVGMALGAAAVVYGALLAYGQRDLKRLVAYTSVSHMGFVLLGIYAGTELALQGVVVQIVCHALATGGLFVVAHEVERRTGTRDLHALGGLDAVVPRLGGFALVLALAALGLPGLGTFVGELLILMGSFEAGPAATIVALTGLVLATAYAVRLIQKAFHGERDPQAPPLADLRPREVAVFATLAAALVWFGLHPQPLLDTTAAAVHRLAGVLP